jgi:hypothetical protein
MDLRLEVTDHGRNRSVAEASPIIRSGFVPSPSSIYSEGLLFSLKGILDDVALHSLELEVV